MRKFYVALTASFVFVISQFVVNAVAGTSNYVEQNYPLSTVYEPFTEPPSPTPEPVETARTCWDCENSTMTEEEKFAAACSPKVLEDNPQMLDECFPDTWEWVCFPEGNCEMYRKDLDPLGIFATPAPLPTPEPTPTPGAEESTAP